jgi:predicted nucleotide-binding protein
MKKNLIQYKLDDVESLPAKSSLLKSEVSSSDTINNVNNKALNKNEVFIVHGHGDLAKVKTAGFIENPGLKPIILQEQSGSGKTIIEKINFAQVCEMAFYIPLSQKIL